MKCLPNTLPNYGSRFGLFQDRFFAIPLEIKVLNIADDQIGVTLKPIAWIAPVG